ncbi:10366_t:CDS:10, partial [Acaulospora colombiana]
MASVEKRQVLPTNVRPTHYNLVLIPDLNDFTFTGTEVVNLNINENTKVITLNANEVEVRSAKLVSLNLKTSYSFSAVDITHDEQKQTVTLSFPDELPAGCTAALHLVFAGSLNDKMVGFYRSSYKDELKQTKYMASTQFEATDARRAFPCWDEPAIKATFDITLIVPSELVALSNMNVISEKPLDNGKKEVKFATTPMMSTYLVAFVVGDLAYVETSTTGILNEGKPVLVRVYATKGNEKNGEFSLKVAADVLEYFAGVFGIPYPLPKCDMVAVPDFEAGAMENWGLITYRTTAILFNPKDSDARFKQRIAYTVSHELAHQGLQRGLQLDALKSSHPIEVPVKDPSEIHQIFDAISYYKGASVIRMLSNYLGEDVFLSGVRRYLKRHEYGNASTDDLWKALAEESGINVGEFMSVWTRVVGYPVLNVTEADSDTLDIRQSRFLSSGVMDSNEDTTTWWIPLGVDLGPNIKSDVGNAILSEKSKIIKLPNRVEDFYQLNARKTGVFRVNYSPERLAKLGQAVKKNLLETSDRVGLIADAGALSRSGHGKTSGMLSLINEFEGEEKYIVWMEINSRLTDLLTTWFEQPEPIYQGLLAFQRHLVSGLVRKLGWEYSDSDDYLTTMLRTLMDNSYFSNSVVEEARRRFNLFMYENDETAFHPNIRGAVYEIVLTQGGEKEFNAILDVYKKAGTADQKIVALTALGFAQQENLIQRFLQFAISDEVKNQDIIYALAGLQSNRKSRRPLWNFMKQNWELIHERYFKSLVLFGNVVKYSTESFSSEDDIRDIENFFKDKNTKEFERPLKQSLENIRVNAAWLTRDEED